MNKAAKPSNLKEHNTLVIKELLLQQGSLTKPEISSITKLSLPTVNRIVDELVMTGYLIAGERIISTKAGRRAQSYSINAEQASSLGVYFYKNKWVCFQANMLGDIVSREEFPAFNEYGNDQISYLIKCIKHELVIARRCSIIGIGIPGVIQNDIIESIPQLKEFDGVNLQNLITEKFHLPVVIENDVKLMTIGYHHEKLNELKDIVFLFIDDGIGAGVIINGHLIKGNNSFAGEFGYMRYFKDENSISVEDLIRSLRSKINSSNMREYSKIHNELIEAVAMMISNCICVINPEAVVINCDEITENDMAGIRKAISEYLPENCIPKLQITHNANYGVDGLNYVCNIKMRKRQDSLTEV